MQRRWWKQETFKQYWGTKDDDAQLLFDFQTRIESDGVKVVDIGIEMTDTEDKSRMFMCESASVEELEDLVKTLKDLLKLVKKSKPVGVLHDDGEEC